MAPLEYTLTTTLPAGRRTNPVDCRKPRPGSTNAPVSPAMARASALCPTGKVRPAWRSARRWWARRQPTAPRPWPRRRPGCHWHAGRPAVARCSTGTTPRGRTARHRSRRRTRPAGSGPGPPGGVSGRAGNESPGLSSGITALLDRLADVRPGVPGRHVVSAAAAGGLTPRWCADAGLALVSRWPGRGRRESAGLRCGRCSRGGRRSTVWCGWRPE